ncbi:MerR family transcriptional regulator [Streptomyces fuscigenes]|uniref:MerR family transcriptional regulator n=1 Tax=Streptomyces fuscigenes TaxID=1528880 RepID=UPI001F491B4C|nr:MerR family transcriptional regulator [Streptomyces fuscigenes]MCF3962199.1 MerR family transcriptional regulator [Streptomyces fuscigenes]
MHLSIGEVAARTGLSVHTLRFYEQEGVLLDGVSRDSAGRRRYTENDVDWLDVCVILRASGMPLPELRRYTEFAREGAGNEAERVELLRSHQRRVAEQMRQLRQCMDLINHKVAVYEDILDGTADEACHAPATGTAAP